MQPFTRRSVNVHHLRALRSGCFLMLILPILHLLEEVPVRRMPVEPPCAVFGHLEPSGLVLQKDVVRCRLGEVAFFVNGSQRDAQRVWLEVVAHANGRAAFFAIVPLGNIAGLVYVWGRRPLDVCFLEICKGEEGCS